MIVSLDVDVPTTTRILAALGNHLNLGAPASEAEFKTWLIFVTDQMTIETEQATAGQAAKNAVPPLGPIG